jgi:hypothetical protein
MVFPKSPPPLSSHKTFHGTSTATVGFYFPTLFLPIQYHEHQTLVTGQEAGESSSQAKATNTGSPSSALSPSEQSSSSTDSMKPAKKLVR